MPNVECPWGTRSVRLPKAVADSQLEHNVRNGLPESALFRRCDYTLTESDSSLPQGSQYILFPPNYSWLSSIN